MKKFLIFSFIAFLVFSPQGQIFSHDLSEFGEWTISLRQPDLPMAPCCGPADAFWVDKYEATEDGFKALVKGVWINVPEKKVIWDRVNPTGRGVIFISTVHGEHFEGASVYCFIPGSGV